MEIKPTSENSEIAKIIAYCIQNTFKNQLLLGDLHSPMNKISKAYKIEKEGEIVGGFTIYEGIDLPVVVFPFGQTELWQPIQKYVDKMNIESVQIVFPIGTGNQIEPPPFLGWNTYTWEWQQTDLAMRLTKKEIEVRSIENLPQIIAANGDMADKIIEFLKSQKMGQWFHPLQLESELSVVAIENDRIVGYAGTHFETPYTVQIGNVAVHQDFRGRGLGRAIVTAVVLGILRTRRVPTLFVNEQNQDAIKFYEKLGFEVYDKFNFYLGRRQQTIK